MFENLKEAEARYVELERLISDPKVISDRNQYQKLARELSQISPLVKNFKKFNKISSEIAELENELKAKGQDKEFIELAESEIVSLKEQQEKLKQTLEQMQEEKDQDYGRDVIVEIRAGTGGREASLFAADLYRMYTKYAAKNNLGVEILGSHPTDTGGFKEIVFSVRGQDAYKKMKFESGVHRVQRVPTTEASGRIHTSTATVAVLIEPEEVEFNIDAKDLRIDVFRSSGPGGQGVNTTDSAVRITHVPTGLVVSCQDERSQLKNKAKGMRVLRARLLDNTRQEALSKITNERKSQIGTGERSEKIRTYNFPDRRVTEHRISLTMHKLESILDGQLDEINEALLKAEQEKKEEVMTEKELLLTALLDCKRADLYTKHYSLNKQQQDNLLSMLQRRKIGEPVQYITGLTEFMGFYFKVDKRVLIPRPETEILVEQTLNLIKNIFSNKELNVLDLCTGSGNIAISLAKLSKNLKIFASDFSKEALEIASENARINKVEDRIIFSRSDLFKIGFQDKGNFFDLIVCNPPYLTTSELDNAAIELSYEPRVALDAGNDGLAFYRKIIKQSAQYLKTRGFLILEIGYNQLEKIKDLVDKSKEFSLEEVLKDYSNFDRVVLLRKNN